MAKKRMKLQKWLARANARVISYWTQRGTLVCYAHVYWPSGPYALEPRSKKVANPEEGWAWIEETALAWAHENNVEFYGSVEDHG